MAVRLGKYAQMRPDPETSINQTISAEYKRDLMDLNVDVFGKSAKEHEREIMNKDKKKSKKSKKSKKRKRKDDESGGSDSDSDRGKDDRDNDRKKRKRRKDRDSKDRGDGKKDRSDRADSKDNKDRHGNSRTRGRHVSNKSNDKKPVTKTYERVREPSPVTSYNSPSSLEQDSDLESNGLELKYDLEPLIHHLHLDRELFNKQIFKIIKGRRRRHLLPKILRDMPDKDLKLNCLTELATWSNKRIRVLMRTGELMSSDQKGALIDPKAIYEEMQKRDEAEKIRELKRAEAILSGIKPDEFEKELNNLEQSNDPEGTGLPDAEKDAGSESEEEDIEAMRANLEKWREAKFQEELEKLRNKHKLETEALAKDLEEEMDLLNKQLEEKELARKKLEELNAQMAKVRREVEKKQAEKQGMVLVEKTTLKKTKPEEVKLEEAGPDALPENRSSDENESSLDMDDMEASNSNRSVSEDIDDIPLADSPSRQQQPKLRKSKAKKVKKEKKKKGEDDSEASPVGPKANLCPDVPYWKGGQKNGLLRGIF